ncbi:hypothetical protein J2TS4_52480 [Paenibacillus sp. J2TS4]|nr:hypothetical protein J2TS4_52480 [Paenibacillus sp. J2TS4]
MICGAAICLYPISHTGEDLSLCEDYASIEAYEAGLLCVVRIRNQELCVSKSYQS